MLLLGTKVWARSERGGHFALHGVPRGHVELAAWPSFVDRKVVQAMVPCDSIVITLNPDESKLGRNWGSRSPAEMQELWRREDERLRRMYDTTSVRR